MRLATGGAAVTVADNALRDVRISGFRALDAIMVTVRDAAWGTYPADVRVVAGSATGATLLGVHGDVFRWEGTVELDPAAVRFEMRGTVLRDVDSRRIGVCLLHPLALAGRALHTDAGSGTFGVAIDPHPPATGFRVLRYDAGVPVTIELSDVFEMEDHRNWSDPGWKSYSPPLTGGGPRRFRAGEELHRSVTVSGPLTSVPSIEVYGRDCIDVTPATLAARPLPARVGAVALISESAAWLREAAARVAERGATRVAVFDPATHTTAPGTAALVRAVLRDGGCDAPVGGGSRAHLAELNRLTGGAPEDWDFVTFPITAQAHHSDTPSVLATVHAMPFMVEQAARIAPGLPLVVGPLALRRRADANSPASPLDPPDPREASPAGAAWLLGSVIALRRAATVTVLFDGAPGGLLRRLHALRGRPFIGVPTGDPDILAATVPGEATCTATLIPGRPAATITEEGHA
ncbi:hypothetical protein [Dactylosporangium matsuzakiense]|uniref:Uncharacterized protein n=1 Tax=Dactylosporangium matsuzakiense TaxID=53360 RepID=A0A9W6KVE8_9ACTN|nr:hypothetical protein [Dactylosporangium matsuzakiense]UWZ42391.1 hypothetical protein Dmats_33145 [Dactylosporangium matsuzakiense]GLL07927.1 hypothetical protein GCM10017581_096860 [Dactylosporangium matsuzakiense]